METVEIEQSILAIVSVVVDLYKRDQSQISFIESVNLISNLGKTWQKSEHAAIPDSLRLMLNLIAAKNDHGLAEFLKMLIVAEQNPGQDEKSPAGRYEAKIRQVLQIVKDTVNQEHFSEFGNSQSNYSQVVAHLESCESQWKQDGQIGATLEFALPPPHRTILCFHGSQDTTSLIQYIRTLIEDSQEAQLLQTATETNTPGDNIRIGVHEKILGAIGTMLIVGLATVHILTPVKNYFREDHDETSEDPQIIATNYGISRWSIIGAIAGVMSCSIVTWNVYNVHKGFREPKRAIKCIIDSVASMLIASGIVYALAVELASFAPRIWVTASLFATLGLVVYCILGAAICTLTGIVVSKFA